MGTEIDTANEVLIFSNITWWVVPNPKDTASGHCGRFCSSLPVSPCPGYPVLGPGFICVGLFLLHFIGYGLIPHRLCGARRYYQLC